ncbi:MAG: amidohydrolase family protein [Lautropia sp.]
MAIDRRAAPGVAAPCAAGISLAPDPEPEPPAVPVPRLACDSHMHLFGPFGLYPPSEVERFMPAEAGYDQYEGTARKLGLQRAVMVQSAAYGVDYRCLCDALNRAKGRWRGIVLLDDRLTDRQLEVLAAAGVVGARLNCTEGQATLRRLANWASRLRDLDWHVEILLTLDDLQEHRALLPELGLSICIDHMGYTRAEQALGHPGLQTFERWLAGGACWTKLSGADRIGNRAAGYADVRSLIDRLLACGPDRLVWGTDWPHVSRRTMPNDGRLFNQFAGWVGDPGLLKRILADNPSSLYGWPGATSQGSGVGDSGT